MSCRCGCHQAEVMNPGFLLGSRTSEATPSAIKNASASADIDKLRTATVGALPESPSDIMKVGGN